MSRKRCLYPMSQFYTFEDEVPEHAKVSTPEDCENCEEGDLVDETRCGCRHCLIEEAPLKIPHPNNDE